MSKNTAYIDNVAYEFKTDETILNFVRRIEGEKIIPTLCDAPNLDPFGSCRVCSVDVALEENGKTKAMASCHTPVGAGMYSIQAQNPSKNFVKISWNWSRPTIHWTV